MSDRDNEHFDRIQLHEQIDRDREIIVRYEEGLAYRRQRVEDARYELGRLDERLGGNQR